MIAACVNHTWRTSGPCFKCRHDIVHTTGKPSPIEINRCFEAVLILIGCIMPKIYPGGHHLYLYIGDNMFDAHMYQEAITYYDRLLAIRPDDPYVHTRKGESFARLRLYRKAVACYNQALALDPNYPVHTRKGESLARRGLHREAVACYNQALVLDPDNPYIHTRKGSRLRRWDCTGRRWRATTAPTPWIRTTCTCLSERGNCLQNWTVRRGDGLLRQIPDLES